MSLISSCICASWLQKRVMKWRERRESACVAILDGGGGGTESDGVFGRRPGVFEACPALLERVDCSRVSPIHGIRVYGGGCGVHPFKMGGGPINYILMYPNVS